jgi:probable F420-dependent oxidoreductase
VRFWLSLNFEPLDQLLDLARMAEELGYEGVVLPDHIAVPSGDTTPHPTGYPLQPEEEFPEPLMCFASMASVTTRLRCLTGVLVVPLRDPFLLAKQLGTLALLSGNRFVLGTGAGWLREEFDLLGQGWIDRGKRMDEMLDLMNDFWADGWGQARGQHYPPRRSGMFPAPAAPIPIWVGGNSKAAVQRAAHFDGYIPMRQYDEVARDEFIEVERLRREYGLEGPYERVAFWPGGDRATALEMAESGGITQAVVAAWEPYSPTLESAKREAGGAPYVRPTLEEKRSAAEAFADQVFLEE